MTQILLIDIK